jgi:predicted dithiol-disulfide oxidoreductase (DUF899 family)
MAPESRRVKIPAGQALEGAARPPVVDRQDFEAQLTALRASEKRYTHQGDAIAAERRRLPMVEVAPTTQLIGPGGPVTLLQSFEGRTQLIAYYFMWHTGRPAQEQCQGCTWVTSHIRELSYFYARDVTFAVFSQGPYEESVRYWYMDGRRSTKIHRSAGLSPTFPGN